MACVGAASTSHLCKSMIMENTRAHPSVDGWSNPLNSKYYVVIIQYTARQHTEKLKSFVHKLSEGQVCQGHVLYVLKAGTGVVTNCLKFSSLQRLCFSLSLILVILLHNLEQVGKQYYNFRLAPEDVSDSLSGFTHNAVTPVGMSTHLPIIMSHKIAALQPDTFWLVRVENQNWRDFVRHHVIMHE